MKTAEEWTKEINNDNAFVDTTGKRLQFHSEVMVEQVKQILLDAMREGMRRAAQVAHPKPGEYANQIEPWLGLHDSNLARGIEKAILSAAENLKESDL